jgi:hypothetical protein
VLFPGAHCDVGGGYPTANRESGLSDAALKWMLLQLGQVGLRLADGILDSIQPDATGLAHQPWSHLPWSLPGVPLGPRSFPGTLLKDPSIAARMAAGPVVNAPGSAAAAYNPGNLP